MSAVRLLYSDGSVPFSPVPGVRVLDFTSAGSPCMDTSRYCRLVRYCRASGSEDDRPLLPMSMYSSAVIADMLDGSAPVKRLAPTRKLLRSQRNAQATPQNGQFIAHRPPSLSTDVIPRPVSYPVESLALEI